MRIFASDRMSGMMQKFGMKEDEAIEAGMLNRAIENAQRKVEAHNFDMRKHLLDYDDVANEQRRVVYQQRQDLMELDDIHDTILRFPRERVRKRGQQALCRPAASTSNGTCPAWSARWTASSASMCRSTAGPPPASCNNEESIRCTREPGRDQPLRGQGSANRPEVMRHFEKALMLNVLDAQWKDHLAQMDYLRQGIHLRGYAQKQPMQEYKREAFEMFSGLMDGMQHEVVRVLSRVQVRAEEDVEDVEAQRPKSNAPVQYRMKTRTPLPARLRRGSAGRRRCSPPGTGGA